MAELAFVAWALGWQELLACFVVLAGLVGLVVGIVLACTRSARRPPPASPQLQTCENCGRPIGRLEQACVFQNHVVCWECHERLRAQSASSSSERVS